MMNPQQLAIFDVQATLTRPYEVNLLEVARQITAHLLSGQKLHPYPLRTQMNRAFNGTDAEGAWQWKDAYEAQEVAMVSWLNLLGKGLKGQPELNLLHRLLQLEQLTLT